MFSILLLLPFESIPLSNHSHKIWSLNNLVYSVAQVISPVVAVTNASPNLDSVYFVNNAFVENINCSKLQAIDLKTSEERHGHLTVKNNVSVNKFPGGYYF